MPSGTPGGSDPMKFLKLELEEGVACPLTLGLSGPGASSSEG